MSVDSADRKGTKRKLEDSLDAVANEANSAENVSVQTARLATVIAGLTKDSPTSTDRTALRRATHALAELAKTEDNVDAVVDGGAIAAVIPLLTHFPVDPARGISIGEDVEKEACFILGLLAIKAEHQHAIADAGALPGLVSLLARHSPGGSGSCAVGPPPLPPTAAERAAAAGGTGRAAAYAAATAAAAAGDGPPPGSSVVRRAADAITNLAHENVVIKSRVRADGGIPPLVALLECSDPKVQRASAGALRTLAFKNEDNKNQIVEGGALPTLIHMLRAEDAGIHYEAVGVIGNLVHSSQNIKRRVLEEGALQPVIGLLSSRCPESQREAALLLGQFATTEPDYKAKIVQRGAVPPLVAMLGAADVQLQEMAAFALGRLAQNADNQAGIVQAGGLGALLGLMHSRNGNLQHNAAFALYGLADNDDNVASLVREGGVQALLDCDLLVQPSKDCVQKTLKRLEDKCAAPGVLAQVLYALRGGAPGGQLGRQRAATALARLARPADLRSVFVDCRGLDVLLGLLTDPPAAAGEGLGGGGGRGGRGGVGAPTPAGGGGGRSTRAADATTAAGGAATTSASPPDPCPQREAAAALFELARKANATAPIDACAPAPPTPAVYLGAQYVNNATLSDVTFVVDGATFHAHRIALLASSDTFRAMFDGHYREKEAARIPIPNIRWPVFEAMMTCVYTGSVEVTPAIAEDLLRAADQYMLEGLKRLCEASLAGALTVDNLTGTFNLAEAFSAPQLGRRCVLFALERYDAVSAALEPAGFVALMRRMVPGLRESLTEQLVKTTEAAAAPAPPAAPAAGGGGGNGGVGGAAPAAAAAGGAPGAGGAAPAAGAGAGGGGAAPAGGAAAGQ